MSRKQRKKSYRARLTVRLAVATEGSSYHCSGYDRFLVVGGDICHVFLSLFGNVMIIHQSASTLFSLQPIPSTLSALQNHQVYCDGKRLGRYQGLLPGAKAVGLLKGHRIYCRSDVVELAGSSRWKKMGRQVKASEEDKPVKVIKLKGEKEEGTGKLYGKWQTDLWVPEAVIDGKVPRNEHGNIEFFNHNPAFLPAGTAHVQGDRIGLVATKLGIDYAPALVGFETKAGRQVPVLDGIIVCSEYSQVLQDAHAVWEQQNWERQVKARGLKVRKMWAKLVKGLLLGARLNEEYGGHA
ncbi:unnamed protein product [Discosporangium mesarthrocarpum]